MKLAHVGEKFLLNLLATPAELHGDVALHRAALPLEQPVGPLDQRVMRGGQTKHFLAQLRRATFAVTVEVGRIIQQLAKGVDPARGTAFFVGEDVAHRPVQLAPRAPDADSIDAQHPLGIVDISAVCPARQPVGQQASAAKVVLGDGQLTCEHDKVMVAEFARM